MATIAIIDSGGANIASLLYAFERLKTKAILTSDAEVIRNADRVLLPGVGAAKDAMTRLIDAGLVQVIRNLTQPVLGICLGMQLAVIEVARNLAGLDGAQSTEFDKGTKHPVIALITEWQTSAGDREERDEESDLGGTPRSAHGFPRFLRSSVFRSVSAAIESRRRKLHIFIVYSGLSPSVGRH